MPTVVDARGKPCPEPVLLTRRALKENAELTVVVDNTTAQENVSGMARSQGYEVRTEEQADGIYLHIRRGPNAPTPGPLPAMTAAAETDRPLPPSCPLVILISGDGMGRGAEKLGGILMRSFLHTLNEVAPVPGTIILVNSGVRLVVEGSPVLDDLRRLAQGGVQILACGTCLGYYQLKDQVAVGTVSNMYTIAETLLSAGKVVTL